MALIACLQRLDVHPLCVLTRCGHSDSDGPADWSL